MMQINPQIIREYDIRGVFNDSLTEKDAFLVGTCLAKYLREKKFKGRIAVCRDGRESSPILLEKLKEGIINQGFEIVDLGIGPTPMLYFSNFVLQDIVAGIMVTGSHNPPSHNGFKFIVNKAAFYGQQIKDLAVLSSKASVQQSKGKVEYVNLKEKYAEFLLNKIDQNFNYKIVWDPGNGAAGEITKIICEKLPGKHYVINEVIDSNFPAHHPDPTVPENLQQLIQEVKKHQANFGIAFDGDGDRIGIVNSDGKIVWGDQILAILAIDLLNKNHGAQIIADVKSSKMLFDLIKEHKGVPIMWKTGHSNIKTRMKELNAPLAGEMSGHIFIADDYYGYDDALYAAIRLLNCYAKDQNCIDKIINRFSSVINTPEIRIQCDEDRKFKVIDNIKRYLDQQDIKYDATDGIRFDNKDGWWLVRASNTQDILVIRLESTSKSGLTTLFYELKKILQDFDIYLTENPLGI
jgi:phosphomannomutase